MQKWTNYDNQDFYQTLSIDDFIRFSEIGGLTKCSDLMTIEQYIATSNIILEVGAGFGRVIDYILKNYPDKKIMGIETSEKLYSFLTQKYEDSSQINIIKQDIHNLKIQNHHSDLILWMWSGIADFSPSEQILILKALKATMADPGILIVDTISPNRIPIGMKKEGSQVFVQNYHGTTIHTYSLTKHEIDDYAKELSLHVKHINYTTTAGRIRSLHIFTKVFM